MPNRLANETSPYLLQHAHNPVDWHPWGEEAFARAREEDKPVLVSIGYAACHWCHVMERESFENEEVAALMNRHFINIKVDREERPDVDHIYMDAVQAISGSGGWPLNVFLTPDRKPFYGGTYFPPRRAFNRASWSEVLTALADAWQNRREEMLAQGESLLQHLKTSNEFGLSAGGDRQTAEAMDTAFDNLMKQADKTWGGFGRAPKFPQTFAINFLLRHHHYSESGPALEQALLSLRKMMQGGIYDHLGGGFARYSTDTEWLVPHFEKMLYDNALLVSTMAAAFQLTGDKEFENTIRHTLAFVERELMHTEGGFYSALDADSEGEEGKYYVWQKAEVETILGEDADLFCRFYNVTDTGNWNEGESRGRNILWITKPLHDFVKEENLDRGEVEKRLAQSRERLLQVRQKRIPPQLDDKVLLGWNALLNMAYADAYAATGDGHYLETAQKNMRFMLETFYRDGEWRHTWKGGEAKYPAFLDDLSYLVAALLKLGEVSTNYDYFNKAAEIAAHVLDRFSDEAQVFFYFTHSGQADVPVRKKEIYDGATPSGNAVMADNLWKLSVIFDKPAWQERSDAMLGAIGAVPVKYPTSFGAWLCTLNDRLQGSAEVAITGKEARKMAGEILRIYLPNRLMMAATEPLPEAYPLLTDKPVTAENHIYLCKNYACQKPVFTVGEFVKLLNL
ncbi:MAG: thioredoxin domain-containing protein [Flavisolibacter sp.]